MKTSKAQIKANKKYRENHSEKVKHSRYRNQAKIFIFKHANETELAELRFWIDEKISNNLNNKETVKNEKWINCNWSIC